MSTASTETTHLGWESGATRDPITPHNHQCAPQTNSRSFLEFSFEHFQTAADESLKPDKVKRGLLLTLTRPRSKEGARCLCSPEPLLLNVFKTTIVYTWRSEDNLRKIGSFHHVGSGDKLSSHQAWQLPPLPSRPSCWPTPPSK